MDSSTQNSDDLEQLRERLQKMPDIELMRFGEAAASCSKAGGGKTRNEFGMKSREAQAEWKRRHPA